LYNILYYHHDEILFELDKKLRMMDRLNKSNYTEDRANNNILDLIKYADLTEFCVLQCPVCNKLQQATAEGCEGLILFICNECDSIMCDIHKKE